MRPIFRLYARHLGFLFECPDAMVVRTSESDREDVAMMDAEVRQEHRWLERLVGEWSFEGECVVGPDQTPMTSTGMEVVRSLGGLWTIGEGEGAGLDGVSMKSVMTLGYDSKAGHFVGTFVASLMTHLWPYRGTLDASGKVLVLDTEGPSFTGEGMAKYRDIIEFLDDDHRTLSSEALGDDGQWHRFMTAHYHRKG